MITKTQRKAERKYAGFIQLVEGVAEELYSKEEWENVHERNDFPVTTHLEMLGNVYETAFQRDPDAFNGIQWINSDYDMPAWVRPGVNWEPA